MQLGLIDMAINVPNVWIEAKKRFEQQMAELYGCHYVNGTCTVHIKGKKKNYETLGERNTDSVRGQRLSSNVPEEPIFALASKNKTKKESRKSNKVSVKEQGGTTVRASKRAHGKTRKRSGDANMELNYD